MNKVYPLIGKHPANLVVMQAINKAAQTDEPILITGETGTGKELIADAIQKQSRRRNETYNKINCGALSSICIESVFCDGNESQFAALEKTTRGLFEELCGGTLLLD